MFSLSEKRKERIAAEKTIDIAEAIIYRISTLLSLSSDQRPLLEKITYEFARNVYVTQSLTIKDIDSYIDFLYLSRYINPNFSQFSKYGFSTILKCRVYVPTAVMAQFNDWDEFRQSSLRSGLMITSDVAAPSVADWNKELSSFLYPFFDYSDPPPANVILERIVQIANEAKDDAATLPEYVALLANLNFKREFQYLHELDAKIEELLCTYVRQLGIIPEQPPSDLIGGIVRRSGHLRRWDFMQNLRIQDLIDEELVFQKQYFNQAMNSNA